MLLAANKRTKNRQLVGYCRDEQIDDYNLLFSLPLSLSLPLCLYCGCLCFVQQEKVFRKVTLSQSVACAVDILLPLFN